MSDDGLGLGRFSDPAQFVLMSPAGGEEHGYAKSATRPPVRSKARVATTSSDGSTPCGSGFRAS